MNQTTREALEAARGSLSQAGTIFRKRSDRGTATDWEEMALKSCRHSYRLVQKALTNEPESVILEAGGDEPWWMGRLREMPQHQLEALILVISKLDLGT